MAKQIGLTGGIGSGKSSVSREFVRLGAALVDADAVVRELQAPGQSVLASIVEAFGEGILNSDGSLDRAALGTIVFDDAAARQRLGALTHGPVLALMAQRAVEASNEGYDLVVVDVPLLFEGRAAGRGSSAVLHYDQTVLVWVPVGIQIERTMARDGCSREEVQARIDAQLPIDTKRSMADHVIDNSGSPQATAEQVRVLFESLRGPKGR